jgi:hypothetical protein
MFQHVPEFRIASGEWKEDAAFHELGDASCAFGDQGWRNVGLLEMAMGCVKEERDRIVDLVAEQLREFRICLLCQTGSVEGSGSLRSVVVDVEVVGVDYLPIEIVILDLVLAEVLRRYGE